MPVRRICKALWPEERNPAHSGGVGWLRGSRHNRSGNPVPAELGAEADLCGCTLCSHQPARRLKAARARRITCTPVPRDWPSNPDRRRPALPSMTVPKCPKKSDGPGVESRARQVSRTFGGFPRGREGIYRFTRVRPCSPAGRGLLLIAIRGNRLASCVWGAEALRLSCLVTAVPPSPSALPGSPQSCPCRPRSPPVHTASARRLRRTGPVR